VIDPLGNCTSWTWANGVATSVQDGEGNLTTYSYQTSAHGYPLLQAIQQPAGTFTYAYDGNDIVQATVGRPGPGHHVRPAQRRLADGGRVSISAF
jgi:hypothetical protein